MGLKLTFAMAFLSDYHAGTGESRGVLLDAVIARGPNGAPEIPGRTLIGLLRQSLYDLLQTAPLQARRRCLASGLPDGESFCLTTLRRDECPLCQVFGSPAHSKGWHASVARVADGAPGQGWPAESAAITVANVRRDPQTRRAEARKLYNREEGDHRLPFTFTLSWPQADAQALAQAAWLVAAARNLRHLGQRRRRGVGEVQIRLELGALTNGGADEIVLDQAWFLAHWQHACLGQPVKGHNPEPLPLPPREAQRPWVPPDALGNERRLTAILRLDASTLIATGNEVGYTLETLGYIPGTVLQAVACSRAAALGHLAPDSANYAAATRYLLEGGIRFGMLYPAPTAGDYYLQPTVPAPRDQYECELEPDSPAHPHPAYATASISTPLAHTCKVDGCGARLRPQSGYLTLEQGPERTPQKYRAALAVSRHPAIEPRLNKVRAGALYAYRALAAQQYFVGEVICGDGAALAYLQAVGLELKAAHEVWVGRGAEGGHGQALLYLTEAVHEGQSYPLLCGAPLAQRAPDLTQPFTITLLSDAIVRDRWGRAVTTLDETSVREALGLPGKPIRSYSAARAVDGFNAYLGLPRWRDLALRAGSAVGIQLDQGARQGAVLARLQALEAEGIGLRRGEGFGQLAVNLPIYGTLAGWEGAQVDLPRALHYDETRARPIEPLDHARFATSWRKAIEAALDGRAVAAFDARNWEGILRALRLRDMPASAEAARGLLADLEQPQAPLPATTVVALDVHTRGKDNNRFLKGKGQAGADALGDLLAELYDSAGGDARLWALGLDQLADAIALQIKESEVR